jgi:hypothetical protein
MGHGTMGVVGTGATSTGTPHPAYTMHSVSEAFSVCAHYEISPGGPPWWGLGRCLLLQDIGVTRQAFQLSNIVNLMIAWCRSDRSDT